MGNNYEISYFPDWWRLQEIPYISLLEDDTKNPSLGDRFSFLSLTDLEGIIEE